MEIFQLMKHIWHECEKEKCMICGQAEGTLEDDCSGPKIKTVKVKIAVAVDPDGDWCSAGWSNNDNNDDMLINAAIENIVEGEIVYWVTAELEIPEVFKAKEIEGKVIKNE